jgi:hypothetical protein
MSAALAPSFPVHSRREHARSNTFLMATLVSETMSGQVRVKNISAGGALVSGRELPRVGQQCHLRRGETYAVGHVVRIIDGSAAIQFANAINVHDWLGAPQQLQSDVDRIMHDARHRYPIADGSHLATKLRSEPTRLAPSTFTGDELVALADQLDKLADSLSDNPVIIAEYQTRLQVLDIASQRLRTLGKG